MKAQTKRWVFAVGIAGSLLAILFYLDRGAPAAQSTHVVRIAADSVRESYIVQAASAGEAASAVVRVGGKVTGGR